jgi:hypothetical protein
MDSELQESENLESVFQEKFHAREYMDNYYPEIANIEKMLEVARHMHKNIEGHYEIDKIAQISQTVHEIIENVAIFDFYRVVTEHFLEEYPEGNACILDIGGGPTIYQHIGLSLVADYITHSEFLESNRVEVISWIANDPSAHNWETYFKLVQRLFTMGEIPQILERLTAHSDEKISNHASHVKNLINHSETGDYESWVRSRIGHDVVHGDMFVPDLGIQSIRNSRIKFDIITSNFVAESASQNYEQWILSMQNMISHIKVGGYFVQTAIKNATWYQVGKEKLPAFGVTPVMIEKACEAFGCRVIYQKVLEGSDSENVGYDGMIFTLARKIS